MFTSKAAADQHDKKIALVESLTEFFMTGSKIDEVAAEDLAMLIANNKDRVAKALKGKPEALSECESSTELAEASKKASKTVGGAKAA